MIFWSNSRRRLPLSWCAQIISLSTATYSSVVGAVNAGDRVHEVGGSWVPGAAVGGGRRTVRGGGWVRWVRVGRWVCSGAVSGGCTVSGGYTISGGCTVRGGRMRNAAAVGSVGRWVRGVAA
jgi:hypothetical protein